MTIERHLVHRLISTDHIAIIPNFYLGDWECDVFALNQRYYTTEYEIKKTKADFNKDFDKINGKYYHESRRHFKHDKIKAGERTNRFYFVTPAGLDVVIPDYAGHITYEFSKYGYFSIVIKKNAPRLHKNKMSSIMQKALTNLSWRYYSLMRIFADPDFWANN